MHHKKELQELMRTYSSMKALQLLVALADCKGGDFAGPALRRHGDSAQLHPPDSPGDAALRVCHQG